MKDAKTMQEILEKVKTAKTLEELTTLAEACGYKLDLAEAEKLFAAMQKSGELSEDELNQVAGGVIAQFRRPGKPDADHPDPTQKFI